MQAIFKELLLLKMPGRSARSDVEYGTEGKRCSQRFDWVDDLLLLFTRPLPRDWGTAEDHRAPEAGQLSRVWTRGRRETESRQRVSGTKSS